jgi:hypothetical protein
MVAEAMISKVTTLHSHEKDSFSCERGEGKNTNNADPACRCLIE